MNQIFKLLKLYKITSLGKIKITLFVILIGTLTYDIKINYSSISNETFFSFKNNVSLNIFIMLLVLCLIMILVDFVDNHRNMKLNQKFLLTKQLIELLNKKNIKPKTIMEILKYIKDTT